MSHEELRRRLEGLNRSPLPPPGPVEGSAPGGGDASESSGPPGSPGDAAPTALEQLIDGRELSVGRRRCYRIHHRLSSCWTPDPLIGSRLVSAIQAAIPRERHLDADLAPLVHAGAEGLLFMDIETCGFAGTPVFLIGTMFLEDGDLHVEQVLARNYEEETAIVARFAELCVGRPTLVTFNGKSFDWPFLRDRAAVGRLDLDDPTVHCDLLHVCRRCYREQLPDCRLQTLETHICKRRRVGDIPGSEIPRAYHQYVRIGDATELREIVHHNFLDLVTLADLLVDLLDPRRDRRQAPST